MSDVWSFAAWQLHLFKTISHEMQLIPTW